MRGEGAEALLLVAGLGARRTDWGDRFVDAISRRRRVILFDNRGTGLSSKPEAAWTLEDMARDALSVLDAVGVRRAHVLGHSMGGMIAQLVALDHPERVGKLVLASTHFGGSAVVHPAPEVAEIFRPARGTPIEEIVRTSMRVITAPGFAEQNPDAIEQLVAYAVAQPTSKLTFASQIGALISSDRSARVSDIRVPTLVVHGTEDSLIPAANGIALAERIAGARLELLPGVGHMPSWEATERLSELVEEFLAA